ncbi:MAG: HlyD family efflux transporter periplasmic adaptor subunit, partial [Deltaproteobacteria bacterium]|nr:HlyD family efflux transporter periplasmic adaptor subunit [Deltaproteobacteria bacterium]
VLAAAMSGAPIAAPAAISTTPLEDAQRARRAFEASRRLAVQHDLVTAEAEASAQVCELLAADRAACLFHDAGSGALWSEDRQLAQGADDRRAVGGLAGYTARTGEAAVATRAQDDARYLAALDDPRGRGDERILTMPVIVDGAVQAVLVAVRSAGRPAFTPADLALGTAFAAAIGPLLVQLGSQVEARAVIDEAARGALFRAEALAARKADRLGDVLRLRPRWLRWGYAMLLAMTVAAGVYVAIGRIGTFSAGPAVIRVQARNEVTAVVGGAVREVAVAPGQQVAAGDLLVRLDDTQERAEVTRLTAAFEAQVRARMLAPSAEATGQAVAGLRLDLDRALARAAEREVRAVAGGIVGEVRARPGQPVAAGEPLLSLVDVGSGYEVMAFLPGSDRPQLARGMVLRLHLAGFPETYQDLPIEAVADELIGPTEAQRTLGPQLGDSLSVAGPVVVVRARVPADGFVADGMRYRWHDGLSGHVEVRVRSESILATVLPAVKKL